MIAFLFACAAYAVALLAAGAWFAGELAELFERFDKEI